MNDQFGNWNTDNIPMIAGWILLVFLFVITVALIAIYVRKVTGIDGGHVDD